MKKFFTVLLFAAMIVFSGCGNKEEMNEVEQIEEPDSYSCEYDDLASYISTVEAEANTCRAYLEEEAMTQAQMNEASLELYNLWDEALNFLWDEIEAAMPEDLFEDVLEEQRAWIKEKEQAVEAEGAKVKGGSMYPLTVHLKSAEITEERVYELYAMLKEYKNKR